MDYGVAKDRMGAAAAVMLRAAVVEAVPSE
jgi:hypothetical protein